MATKQTKLAAQAAAPATAPATAPAAAAPALTVTLPTGVAVPAVLCGGASVQAAPNVVKRTAKLGKVPPALASVRLVAGRPCKVRVPYTLQGVTAMLAHIATNGPSTGTALAAVANGDLLGYAVRSGWLVPVKA